MPVPQSARRNLRRPDTEYSTTRPHTTQNTPQKPAPRTPLGPVDIGKQQGPYDTDKVRQRVYKWQQQSNGSWASSDPGDSSDNDDATPSRPTRLRGRSTGPRPLGDPFNSGGNNPGRSYLDAYRANRAKHNRVDEDVRAAAAPKKRLVSDEHWKANRASGNVQPIVPAPDPPLSQLQLQRRQAAASPSKPLFNPASPPKGGYEHCDAWVRTKLDPEEERRARQEKLDSGVRITNNAWVRPHKEPQRESDRSPQKRGGDDIIDVELTPEGWVRHRGNSPEKLALPAPPQYNPPKGIQVTPEAWIRHRSRSPEKIETKYPKSPSGPDVFDIDITPQGWIRSHSRPPPKEPHHVPGADAFPMQMTAQGWLRQRSKSPEKEAAPQSPKAKGFEYEVSPEGWVRSRSKSPEKVGLAQQPKMYTNIANSPQTGHVHGSKSMSVMSEACSSLKDGMPLVKPVRTPARSPAVNAKSSGSGSLDVPEAQAELASGGLHKVQFEKPRASHNRDPSWNKPQPNKTPGQSGQQSAGAPAANRQPSGRIEAWLGDMPDPFTADLHDLNRNAAAAPSITDLDTSSRTGVRHRRDGKQSHHNEELKTTYQRRSKRKSPDGAGTLSFSPPSATLRRSGARRSHIPSSPIDSPNMQVDGQLSDLHLRPTPTPGNQLSMIPSADLSGQTQSHQTRGLKGRSSNDRASLKRRIAKHSDLISVLSMDREGSKSIRSARSIQTVRKRHGLASFDELMTEVKMDEIKYMRELRTLVDGVIPVLLSSVLSKSTSGSSVGLFGLSNGSLNATQPIISMGTALERLKSSHNRLPHNSADALSFWAQSAHRVYSDYLKAWRMGLQDLVVNLAPAEDKSAGLNGSKNIESNLLIGEGEKVDVAFLLKRPLVRIRTLAKTLKAVADVEDSAKISEVAVKYQDLVAEARQRQNEEKGRLEDEAAASIDATRARNPKTLAQLAGVRIDPSKCVKARDLFDLNLHHSSGQQLDCHVELVCRDGPDGRASSGDILICEVDETSRWLLFPPVHMACISARLANDHELVLMLRNSQGEVPWQELFRLRSNDSATCSEWTNMLGTNPTPPEVTTSSPTLPNQFLTPIPNLTSSSRPGKTLGETDIPLGEKASIASGHTDSTAKLKKTPRPFSIPSSPAASAIESLKGRTQSAVSSRLSPQSDKITQQKAHTQPQTEPRHRPAEERAPPSRYHTRSNEKLQNVEDYLKARPKARPRSYSGSSISTSTIGYSVWMPSQTDDDTRDDSLPSQSDIGFPLGFPMGKMRHRHTPSVPQPFMSKMRHMFLGPKREQLMPSLPGPVSRNHTRRHSEWIPRQHQVHSSDESLREAKDYNAMRQYRYSSSKDQIRLQSENTWRPVNSHDYRQRPEPPVSGPSTGSPYSKLPSSHPTWDSACSEKSKSSPDLTRYRHSEAQGQPRRRESGHSRSSSTPLAKLAEPMSPINTAKESPTQSPGSKTPALSPASSAVNSNAKSHRRSSSPLKHEYAPSTTSDDSSVEANVLSDVDDDAASISSESSAEDFVPSLPPSSAFKRGLKKTSMAPQSPASQSPGTIAPSQSASQAGYHDGPGQGAPGNKQIASIFCWSDTGQWESLYPDECSVIVSPGLIKAFEMSAAHSIPNRLLTGDESLPGRPEGIKPLIGLELTPLVPLRRGTAIDISIRSPPTADSQIKKGNNVMFRSRNNQECDILYSLINQARINNPTYIALQNARGPFAENSWAAVMDRRSNAGGSGKSWWKIGGAANGRSRNSYRAGSSRRTPSVAAITDQTESSVATMDSAISALKRFAAGSKMFDVARSTIQSRHSPNSGSPQTRSSATFSSDDSNGGEPGSGTSTPPAGAGLDPSKGTPMGIREAKIRLYERESASKWRDMGSARLTIMHPPRPAGMPPPLEKDGRLRQEKRIIVEGKTKGETLLDVTLGESSFERVARTGIAVSVWEQGEVAKKGSVLAARVRVYMVQMKSERDAAYTFSLVGRLRY